MLKADAAAVLGLCVVAALLLVTVVFVVSRWRGTPMQWPTGRRSGDFRPATTISQTYETSEWYDRLEELNFLLARVQASDSTLAQLGEELVRKLRSYFGSRLTAPPPPPGLNAVINRVMLLEGWLQEVQEARTAHQTLPADVADQVDRYLEARQRRLDS